MNTKLAQYLINFFNNCEDITYKYAPPDKYHETFIKNGEGWEKSITKIKNWNYPNIDKDLTNKIKILTEINPCLDILENIFEPRVFSRGDINDNRPYSKEETASANRRCNADELTRLYFKYKDKKEIESTITTESFSKDMADFACSNQIVSHFKALLIGFKPKDFNEANFNTFQIRKISDVEKLEMMNKFDEFFSNLTPFNITYGIDGAWVYDYWITGKIKKILKGKRSTFFHVYWDKSFSEVLEELSRIIKLLRIGSGFDVGIRNFYAKSTYPHECPIYDKWFYQKYGFGNYAVSERKESGDSSRQFNLSANKDFLKSSLEEIRKFSESYEKYKLQPIEQISLGIKYYLEAFEVNYAIYCFTSFMMAFEALLNSPPEKSDKLSKEKILLLLKEITHNIENNNKSTTKQLKRLNPPHSINKAISIGKKIYSKEKQLQGEFNNFFNPENGCFKLRNELLHGNFNKEINKKVIHILPELLSYIRKLLFRIIELRINGELICDESDYYKKLEQMKIIK